MALRLGPTRRRVLFGLTAAKYMAGTHTQIHTHIYKDIRQTGSRCSGQPAQLPHAYTHTFAWYVGIRKTFVLTYVTSLSPVGLVRSRPAVCWLAPDPPTTYPTPTPLCLGFSQL